MYAGHVQLRDAWNSGGLCASAGSRDQAHPILQPLAGALQVLCSQPEQERMLSRWLGQLSADQFASRCVRPIMRHVDSVAHQLVCCALHEHVISRSHAETSCCLQTYTVLIRNHLWSLFWCSILCCLCMAMHALLPPGHSDQATPVQMC